MGIGRRAVACRTGSTSQTSAGRSLVSEAGLCACRMGLTSPDVGRRTGSTQPDGAAIGGPKPPRAEARIFIDTGAPQASPRIRVARLYGSPQPPPGGGLQLAERLDAASARLRAAIRCRTIRPRRGRQPAALPRFRPAAPACACASKAASRTYKAASIPQRTGEAAAPRRDRYSLIRSSSSKKAG